MYCRGPGHAASAHFEMKPRPLLIAFGIHCLIYTVSYAVNPACECVVYQSYGRSQGTFTSPNFPEVYPPNINCILYTFIGDLDEVVELTFLEFDTKVPITNKCTDFLKFFLDLERPEVNERHTWNYELCGNISMIQKKHYSSGRSMILEFRTDPLQGNHTGFRGIFKFLDKSQFEIQGGTKRWGTQCTYDFYSHKNTKTGRFFSPRYPQNYPPGATCVYVFSGNANERVRVTFQNIQLESIDGSCSDSPDYIIVRDGLDASRDVIALYCNTLNGEQVISSGPNLYIEFLVDDRKQRQGFAAAFQFIKEDQFSLGKSSPTPTSFPYPPGPNTHSPGDSPGDLGSTAPTTKRIVTDCTFEFSSSQNKNGTFSSPHYPNPYPNDISCRYAFHGSGRERVQIMFTELDLNYPSGDPKDPYDCEDVDAVTASVIIGGQPRDIGVYCGTKRPPMLMSNDNRMEVVFTTRSSSTAKGFKAKYKFVTDFGIKTGQQDPEMVCGFMFRSETAPNGTFTSPNFPGLYPRNTECHYLFYGKENERIYVTFPYFDVEGIPPTCVDDTQSDYVEFSNFNIKLKDRKMNRFCGTKEEHQKKAVNSDGNFFRVTFKSNDVYDATGFEAFYQFRKYEDPFSPGKRVKSGSAIKPTTAMAMLLLPLVACIIQLWS